jgi:endonuclease YncB( thermonuclease family)
VPFLPTTQRSWPGFFIVALLAGTAGTLGGACNDATTPLPVAADSGAADTSSDDASSGDSAVSKSQCPAPKSVAPDAVGAGYLKPETVTLVRDIDGDTAHFKFATRGELDVRFLYVNTEESKTTETTAFGIETGKVVDGYLKAASEIVVVIQADNKNPTQPNLDPFGRTLGLVFVDGDLFQTRLVREGWTAYYTLYGCAADPMHTALLDAEAEANAEKRGIWAPDHPTDYRPVLAKWIHDGCRPNPFNGAYCP